jgi:urease accessory protein
MVIEHILGKVKDFNTSDAVLDPVELTHEELLRPHQKLTSKGGEKIAVSLRPGESLKEGDVVYAGQKKIIYIDLIKEDVLVIKPKGHIQWGRAAFNIGNFHHSAYLTEESILTSYDPVIEALLSKIGVEFTREYRKLYGEKANVQTGTHGHKHDHVHEHGQGHEHDHVHEHGQGHEHEHK